MIPSRLAILLCVASATAIPSVSEAQIFLGPPRDRVVESRGPVRGYSGFIRDGARQYYCDYVRYPNRTCSIDRAGRERCRITSWRMVQRCS